MNMIANHEDEFGFHRYCLVEARKILSELYQRMIVLPEFSDGTLPKPYWYDEFWSEKN